MKKFYKFNISYLEDNVILSYTEYSHHKNSDDAYDRFEYLVEALNVGGYYYLCKWREADISEGL